MTKKKAEQIREELIEGNHFPQVSKLLLQPTLDRSPYVLWRCLAASDGVSLGWL